MDCPQAARSRSTNDERPVLTVPKAPMSFIKDLWKFLRVRKKFWLAPLLLMMALLGSLIVLAQGSAIAPFIYTLF